MPPVLRWTVQALGWTVATVASAAVLAAVLVPRVAGATPYVVLTGSMQPGLPPGTLVVARPAEDRSIAVGDVITYQLRPGEPAVVTHRVAGLSFGEDGSPLYRTKGDANDAVDSGWVQAVQVRGELWYAVPWIGRVGVLLAGPQRDLVARVAGGALLAYAVAALLRSARCRASGQVSAHG